MKGRNACTGGERHAFPGTLPLFTKRLLNIVTRDLACTQTHTRTYEITDCVPLETILSLVLGPGLEPGEDAHQQSAAMWSGFGSGWRGVKEKGSRRFVGNHTTHSPHRVKKVFKRDHAHQRRCCTAIEPAALGTKVSTGSTLNQLLSGAVTPEHAAGALWSQKARFRVALRVFSWCEVRLVLV